MDRYYTGIGVLVFKLDPYRVKDAVGILFHVAWIFVNYRRPGLSKKRDLINKKKHKKISYAVYNIGAYLVVF